MTTGCNGVLTEAQHGAAEFLAGYWKEDRRHKAALALSGGLLRDGWSVPVAEAFLGAVAEAAGDEEVAKRVALVKPTAEKLAAGQPATGWPALAGLIGPDGEAVVRELRVRLGQAITLEQLAEHKALPVEFLQSLGLYDLAVGGVGIPYHDGSGRTVATKARTALQAGRGSYWPKGKRLLAYGEERLESAVAAGYLILTEGESDVWSCWYHGYPALGLPGVNAVKKTLMPGHVGVVRRIYAVQEPDGGGEDFIAGIRERLAELGWDGQLRVVKLEGFKDPSALHQRYPDLEEFRERFQQALDKAVPVERPEPAALKQAWGDLQPIPDDLPPVVPFDYDLLPVALREFAADVAERMQCPPDFPAVALMVALAGVVGKKVGIRPKRHDDWLVVPNLWGAVIGRPGIMKTPAIRQPIRFLHRLQFEARKRYEQELRDYEDKCLVAEAQKKAKKKAIEEASKKKLDPLAVAKEFTIDEPQAPTAKRYLVNDSTVEKLGELLNLNPTGLTVFRDELIGFLRQLDKEGQESARAFYLEAWDGLGTFTYDRIGRGTLHIESVTVSILGGIQPGRLLDYLGAALKGGAGDDGLLQRFQLLVYPDVDKRFRNVDRWPDTSAKARVWAVFQQLDALDPVVVGAQREESDDGVPFLHFAPVAQGLFDDWRAKLEEAVRSGDEHPAFESHLAKYRSLVPSLALLIHLVDGAHGPVSEGATRKAIAWVGYLESHARRIYGIAVNSAAIAGKALAKRLSKGELKDGFTLRDIYRKHWAGLSEKQAGEQAVDLLLDLSWLKEAVEDTGGKPKTYYHINPALLTKTAPAPCAKSAKSPPDPPFGTFGTGTSAHFQAAEEDESTETAPAPSAKSAKSPPADSVLSGDAGSVGSDQTPPDDGVVTSEIEAEQAVSNGAARFRLVRNAGDLAAVGEALQGADLIGLDTETTGLDPRTDCIRLLSVAAAGQTFLVDCFQVDPRPLFPLLADKLLVMHSGQFDLSMLAPLGFTPGPGRDTMLLSRLLYGTRKAKGFHSLESCAERELGRTLDKKHQRTDWSKALGFEQLAYAAADAEVLLPLYEALDAKVKAAGLETVADIESRCLPAVVWLAGSGVLLDVQAWRALAVEADGEAHGIAQQLDALAPPPPEPGMFSGWNWDSPQQVLLAFQAAGCPLESTGDEILAKVKHPLAELLRDYRSARKRHSTYGPEWLERVAEDGRVYASWNQLGADSGRMACSKPNLQNLPRGAYRRCIVAPAGRVLVKADFSQIELRIAAKITGDMNMLAAYRDGQDLHALTARQVLGVQAVTKDQRQLAKALNFGLLYGMGGPRFREYAQTNYGVQLTPAQAAEYREAFFRAYPGLRRWHRSVPDKPIETRTLAGRRRLAVGKFTEKLNTPVQGTGADGLKLALALLWERRNQAPGACPVLAVHDEIVVEADSASADAVAAWLKAAMNDAMRDWLDPVPVEVSVTVARTWGGDDSP